MEKNQNNDVKNSPNPPLGKKPALSDKEMKNMRMVLQFLSIQTPIKNTYFYNIVEKESNWGLSSNQRLLFLNVNDKAISYLSKVPTGYLPYTTYEEIAANNVKQKLYMTQAQNFQCNPVKGKISSFTIQWTDKEKKDRKWIITVGSSKLMNDWIGLIHNVKDGSYDREKYETISKNGNNAIQSNNTPTFANNPSALGFPNTIQPNTALNQPNNVLNHQNQLINNKNTFSNEYNHPSKLGYNQSAKQFNPNTPSISNPNTSNSQAQKPPIQSNLQNNNLNPVQSNTKIGNQNNKIINNHHNQTNYANLNNFGSSNTDQPYRGSSNKLQQNFKSHLPISSQQNVQQKSLNNLPSFHGQNSSISNSNMRQNGNYENYGASSTVKSNENINQNLNRNPNLLNPSQSQPGDFVQELKRQRKKNPQKFVLNNELSQKKFQNMHYNSPQTENYYQQNYDSKNSNNNFLASPKRVEGTIGNRSPSQKYLNRQNSEKKFSRVESNYNQSVNNQNNYNAFSRTKTNQNFQSQKELSAQNLPNQPSRSKIATQSRAPLNSQVGLNNNYDQQFEDNNDLNQHPFNSNNINGQSTKNLNHIRSDYLRKKANKSDNIYYHQNQYQNQNRNQYQEQKKLYPSTSKNQSIKFNNNQYEQEQPLNNFTKNRDPSIGSMHRFDSTQKKRENSMASLNKIQSNYLPNSKLQKSYPSYNDIWLQTSNPNKKLETYNQFVNRSRQLVREIIDQFALPASNRQFQPIESIQKKNLYIYEAENMIIKLHFFNHQESLTDSQDNINLDSPVLYDHATVYQVKREFYNYNLILSVTANQGKIKVPLCSYVEYRGILAVVKADIPPTYRQVEPYPYQEHFEALQNIIKVRFLFNTFDCYESQPYRGGEGKFILLWNLNKFIPEIPNSLKNHNNYFRKQFLLQYDQILDDLESSSQAHAFTLRHILPQLLSKLQSLETQILHSKDLRREFHRVGLSLHYLPEIYKKTTSSYLKKVFMSEIVAGIFTEIVRSQLNHAFGILPAENIQNISSEQLNNIFVSCAHLMINEFFSYTLKSENTWKLIVSQASKRYRMIVSKEDVIAGFILSSIVFQFNIECDFKHKSLVKQKKFFVHENILPREIFLTFLPCVRRYDMQSICPTYSKCKQIIESEDLSVQNYEQLTIILNLQNRTTDFPQYYTPIIQELKSFISNFIPYTMERQYQHLDVYEFLYEEPLTHYAIKTAFLAIKWLIKANLVEKANQLFQIKFHQLSYWLTEYNSAIVTFYDFFSMFYASVGDFEESICLAKSSLINMTKILGPGALPVADKHYQLGNIYFKINKKNEALKQYNKTKQILINHQKTTIPEYGIILLKISLLCLNFGELTECLANAIEAEKIFQKSGGSENEEVECFQILARVYQITKKPGDMNSLCEACNKTLGMTENPKIMERMLKIISFPKISQMSSNQQKSLLPILSKLQDHKSSSSPTLYSQSFNFLHKMSMKNISIKKKLYNYLQNVSILSEEINRKDLIRKHSSFNERAVGQAQQMLVLIEAVGNMIGWNFLIGCLKEGWYD